jgi:nucleotide-binding universal stress UspA family protein
MPQETELSVDPMASNLAPSPCVVMVYDGTALTQQHLLRSEFLGRWADAVFLLVAVLQEPAALEEPDCVPSFMPEAEAAERAHVSFILERGVEQLRARGLRADAITVEGSCVDEILRIVKSETASLLAISHRPEAPYSSQWWQVHVVRRLIERAPCGVLLVAPQRVGSG